MHPRSAALLAHVVGEALVTRQQLVDAGADRGLVDREVAAGRWVRPFPDRVLTTPSPTVVQLAAAALSAGGPASALTARVACRLHGLRDVPDGGPLDLLVPVERRMRVPDGVRLRRTSSWPDTRLHTVHGLRVVEPDQAVADAALRTTSLQDVRALVLAAVADGQVRRDRLRLLLDRGPQRGSGHLRRALHDADLGAASAPEAELVDLLLPVARRLGLELLVNAELLRDGLLLGRLDVLLAGRSVAVEVDSVRHHGSGADLEATLRRHDRLTAAGLRVVHVTPWAVRRTPRDVVARVHAALQQGHPLQAGLQVRPRPTR